MIAFKKNLWYKRQNFYPVRKFSNGVNALFETLLTGFAQLNPWKTKSKKIFSDLFRQWMRC